MYSVSPNNSTTSLSDEDVDDVDVQDMQVSFHYPKDVSPERWSSSFTRGGTVRRPSPSSSTLKLSRKPTGIAALLPPEILIHVLRQLHTTRDLYHSLLVSRIWCSCAVELLWQRPSFQTLDRYQLLFNVITSPSQTAFEYASFIRRLNFAFIGPEITDSLFTPLSACTKLERLTLAGCTELSDEALLAVLPGMRNMVALDLSNIPHLSDASVVAVAQVAPKLQGVNLSGCKYITDAAILSIAENCPLLRRLKLFSARLVTDNSIMALARGCPVLLEIDLNGCSRITDFSTRELWTHCPHLREVRFAQCTELTDLGFPAVPSSAPDTPNTVVLTQANGRQIEINPFPSLQPAPHEITTPLRLNHPAEHLRILDLTLCALLTDDAIAGIVSAAPKLRNLVLAKCPQLTDAGVESICKLGKHLHYLHLGHASLITDKSVRILARSCSRLRYIDLACCPLLTDMSVSELAALPKLRRIGLVRVTNLTDQAIFTLADRHSTLERIHLSYCENISILAIHFLLQRLLKLTHLSLTGVPAFRRPELQKFCRSPPGEFNSTQRAAFCVYSGKGVNDLRKYLSELLEHFPDGDHDNDTDYDAEEEDDLIKDADGPTAAEQYVMQQREHDLIRESLRRERDRGRVGSLGIGGITTLPPRRADHQPRAIVGPISVGNTVTSIAREEVFEEDARTPLSRFSSSMLSSLPMNPHFTLRRAGGPAGSSSTNQQPQAGPSTAVFVEDTKASSLATTPSPTEQHPTNRPGNGAIISSDARPIVQRNFADSPVVESSAPTPSVESSHRFHTAFFHYPAYGGGYITDNSRRGFEGRRVPDSSAEAGPSSRAGPLRTFTPTEQSNGSLNGRHQEYTPDFVLSNFGNRRPAMLRSASDSRSSTPALNGVPGGYWQNHDLELGSSNESITLQYPYGYYQQPVVDPSAWPPQNHAPAYEHRARHSPKDHSRSKRRQHQHGANSPIPFLPTPSSPTTKELQESVHSALANGAGTSYNAVMPTSAVDPQIAFGVGVGGGISSGAVAPADASSGSGSGSGSPESSRGRSARRTWRSTFSAAENYASALFFGRAPPANGSGNVSSASSSSSGREGGRAS